MSAFPHSLQLVKPREIFIRGITADGRTFRPSDWAERLAGLMARFRPAGLCRKEAHLGYSPYCVPTVVEGVRCLVVSESLRDTYDDYKCWIQGYWTRRPCKRFWKSLL
ncbi:MAG: DUF3579 domain-containing protein [Thiomonas sp.]